MRKGKKRAFTGFGVFLLIMLIGSIFFYLNFKTIEVSGPSMNPTFKSGDRVLVSKAYWLVGPIKDKDIVVLHDPGGPGNIIKRVYRLGGEDVDFKWMPDSAKITNAPYKVPDGCIYVLGDNRPVSEDSRKFGPVDLSKVLGKVIILGKK